MSLWPVSVGFGRLVSTGRAFRRGSLGFGLRSRSLALEGRYWVGLRGISSEISDGEGSGKDEERQPRKMKRVDSEAVALEVEDALGRLGTLRRSTSFSTQKESLEELLDEIRKSDEARAKEVVPWFLNNMSHVYFRQVPQELRTAHLEALLGTFNQRHMPDVTMHHTGWGAMSVISQGPNRPAKLNKQLQSLPTDLEFEGMSIFNSTDGLVSINIFEYSEEGCVRENEEVVITEALSKYLWDLASGVFESDPRHPKMAPYLEHDTLVHFLKTKCSAEHVMRSSPRRLCRQVALYHKTMEEGEDEVGIEIEPNWNGNSEQTMLTMAITNVLPIAAMRRILEFFASNHLSVIRVHLDIIDGPTSEDERTRGATETSKGPFSVYSNRVAMFRILVEPYASDDPIAHMEDLNKRLIDELPTVSKWIDDRALNFMVHQRLSSREAELTIALCDLAHAILAPKDGFEFARSNIELVVMDESRMDFTRAILDLFLKRFDPSPEAALFPEKDSEKFRELVEELRKQIKQSGELQTAQETFGTLLDIISSTLRTNAFVKDRFGLSLRLDPEVCVGNLLDSENRPEVPHGIFFIHGRRFTGFHVRFRDIARGGLRVVTPRNKEMHAVESSRQLMECYDLSYAQQLKNKDIAEGGSKAVCLIDRSGAEDKSIPHLINKSLKAMVNSILDLITPDPKDKAQIVDFMHGQEEFIYLGPDEQVSPSHINWIVQRAAQRNYPMPSAFMSSKPDAGINHKEFGVTSEGVAVFLHEALQATGVDVTKPFTVKITGGPDGDVAGNILKILHREYGENARIVGLADGTAGLEDPDGIPWEELLGLFREVQPLSSFSRDKLGPNADFYLAKTPKEINKRNTMHNRVKADAFVPAGGRPATINDSNWDKFLLEEEGRKPSSPLIVEGANLFLTPKARQKLSEHGCVIVKDSSANKCGVICSSFEIIASMLLEREEFLSLKKNFVVDVLAGLRTRAKKEAELMFREYRFNPSTPLPPVSQQISFAINRSTDAVAAALESLPEEEFERLLPIIRISLPKALMDFAWDRFTTRIPKNYVRFQLASILASEIVYREGVSYVMSIKDEVLAELVLEYARKSIQLAGIADRIANGEYVEEEERKLVANVVRFGGARTAVEHHLI